MSEDIYNPSHYTSSGIESVEVIEAFFRHDSHLATAYAYLHRAGKKAGNSPIQDYKKAVWWLYKAANNIPPAKNQGFDRGLATRVRHEIYSERRRIGCAFQSMVAAASALGSYICNVKDAISWLRQEITELEDNDTETRGNQGV